MKFNNSFFEDDFKKSTSSMKGIFFQGSNHDEQSQSLWTKRNAIVHQSFRERDCDVVFENRTAGNTQALNFNKFFQWYLLDRSDLFIKLYQQYSSKKISLAFIKSR